MQQTFGTQAAKLGANIEQIRAYLLIRDGLVIDSFPEGAQEDAKLSWMRLASLGNLDKGFIAFRNELWIYVQSGAFAVFATAKPEAKPGLLIDVIGQLVKAVEADSPLRVDEPMAARPAPQPAAPPPAAEPMPQPAAPPPAAEPMPQPAAPPPAAEPMPQPAAPPPAQPVRPPDEPRVEQRPTPAFVASAEQTLQNEEPEQASEDQTQPSRRAAVLKRPPRPVSWVRVSEPEGGAPKRERRSKPVSWIMVARSESEEPREPAAPSPAEEEGAGDQRSGGGLADDEVARQLLAQLSDPTGETDEGVSE